MIPAGRYRLAAPRIGPEEPQPGVGGGPACGAGWGSGGWGKECSPGEPLPPGRRGPLGCPGCGGLRAAAQRTGSPRPAAKAAPRKPALFLRAQAVFASSQPGARCPVPGEGLTQTLGVRAARDLAEPGPRPRVGDPAQAGR